MKLPVRLSKARPRSYAGKKPPPTVMVEAVEVDGDLLFFAGAAEPGRRLAIYIDNELIGFATGTREGRFLLEKERQLNPGEHVIRADIFDSGGLKVAGRAEVPLIHEPADVQIAAAPKQADNGEVLSETAVAPTDVADDRQADAATPAPSQALAAKSAEPKTVEALQEMPEPKVALANAEPPMQAQQKLSRNDAGVAIENPEGPVSVKKVAESVVSKVEQPAAPAARPADKIINVAKFEKSEKKPRRVVRTGSSVIIRRGDNLWRISYRTYGRGIRYSTIYQANLQQLRSPHLIYPGQILKVPKKKFGSEG